jgi:hypothetical protein
MIGTDRVAGVASAQTDRIQIQTALNRADVASQLQAMGVDVAMVKDRVASMTDEEASSLAGKLHAVPAGADSWGWWLLAAVVVGVLVWWYWGRR